MLGITGFTFFLLAVFLLNVTPGSDTAYIVGRRVAARASCRRSVFPPDVSCIRSPRRSG